MTGSAHAALVPYWAERLGRTDSPRSRRARAAAAPLPARGDRVVSADLRDGDRGPIPALERAASLQARRAAAAGSAASSRAPRRASSTAPARPRGSAGACPLRGGHSISNSIDWMPAGSRSLRPRRPRPSCRPPGAPWRAETVRRSSAGPGLLLELAQRRLGRRFARLDHAFGDHPGAGVLVPPERSARLDQQDFGHAVSPPEQQDAGAMRRRHPTRSARRSPSPRSSRRRAAARRRTAPPPGPAPRHIRAGGSATHSPSRIGGDRRRQRAHLDADLALVLAEPVPVGDAHRRDRQRPARPDDDPPLARARCARRRAARAGRRSRSRGAGRR